MLRRSPRLVSSGYYKDLEPVVSYRETTYRLITRHKTIKRPPPIKELHSGRVNSNSRDFLLAFLPMCFGLVYLSTFLDLAPLSSLGNTVFNTGSEELESHIRELEEEIAKLKSQMNYLLPVADTLPNFALEPTGACILRQMTSEDYQNQGTGQRSVSPRIVIQGESHLVPGRCWAFAGEQGHLSIHLSHKVTITHVTLGHISKALSPTQSTFTAPKEFSVYGMKTLDDEDVLLGTFLYDHEGDPLQTFKLPDHKTDVFSYVTLKVNSNWGNPAYTCLYSFRVHGKMENSL